MPVPESLRYSKTHEWVAVDGDTATIGITDFAVQLLSDLVFMDLPKPGKAVEQGVSFGEIESVKHVSDLYAPVSGEVIAANTELPDNLQLLADDPYGRGWLIKVRLREPAQVAGLLDAAAYAAHCAAESA